MALVPIQSYGQHILKSRGFAWGEGNSQAPFYWDKLACGIVPHIAPPKVFKPTLVDGAAPIDVFPDVSNLGHNGGWAVTASANQHPLIRWQDGAFGTNETTGHGSLVFFNNSTASDQSQRIELGTWDVWSGRITVLIRTKWSTLGDRVFSKADGAAQDDHDWMLSRSGTNKRARFNIGGTVSTRITGTGVLVVNEWDNWGYTYDGINESLTNADYHGTGGWASFAKTGSIVTGTGKEIWLTANPTTNNGSPGCDVAYCFIWDKGISTDLCDDFYADPLKMFRLSTTTSVALRVPVAPPVGGFVPYPYPTQYGGGLAVLDGGMQ